MKLILCNDTALCMRTPFKDEQLYRSLHEEINHLALKLEKQGKTEGKNISTRKKHINKMLVMKVLNETHGMQSYFGYVKSQHSSSLTPVF